MSRRTATFEMAVSQINENGRLLGQAVEIVVADDYCDSEQAVAAANKLIAYGVDVVIGHNCSGAAIPASKVYADAGVLMITGGCACRSKPVARHQPLRAWCGAR